MGMPGWAMPFAAIYGTGEMAGSVSKVIGTLNEVNKMRSSGNLSKNLEQFAKDPYTESYDDKYMTPADRLKFATAKKDWFEGEREKDLLRSKKYGLENFAYRRRDQPNVAPGQIWDEMQQEGVVDPSMFDPTKVGKRMDNLEFGRKEADTRKMRQGYAPNIPNAPLRKAYGESTGREDISELNAMRQIEGVGTGGKTDPNKLTEPQARKQIAIWEGQLARIDEPSIYAAMVAQFLDEPPEMQSEEQKDRLEKALKGNIEWAKQFVSGSKKKKDTDPWEIGTTE